LHEIHPEIQPLYNGRHTAANKEKTRNTMHNNAIPMSGLVATNKTSHVLDLI